MSFSFYITIAPLSWHRSAALALGASLLLTGCAGGPGRSREDPGPTAKQEPQEAAPDKDSENPAAASPDSCTELTREAEVPVDGKVFGTCIDEAVRAAKTGKMVLTSTADLPKSTTVFEYVPEYTAYGTTDGEPTLLLTKDSTFFFMGNRWVEADPTSTVPSIQMVTTGVELAKQSSSVESLIGSMSLCPQWVSMGKADIENGSEPEGYQYRCDGSYELIGVKVTDMNIWLNDGYRMIQQKSVGTIADMTVPSITNFSGWGEPVEIPKPEELK
ncbi:hypothetical protein [Arthrobacter roseus]|uniref:hypothetical protein n=1 Tax=Arthrobacter roseus TaxID=136274 RepID=UPI001962596F|nr:hypothetical protein [Arthrobacter roseus]MBM7847681.1 hypothetical protein [Arthrobacter roseus]